MDELSGEGDLLGGSDDEGHAAASKFDAHLPLMGLFDPHANESDIGDGPWLGFGTSRHSRMMLRAS